MGSVEIPANPPATSSPGGPEAAGSSGGRVVFWAAGAGAFLALAAAIYASLRDGWLEAAAIAAVLAAAGAGLYGYRRGVAAVGGAIRRANDGLLEPVEVDGIARAFVGPLAADYNVLARNLGSLFGEMEQAQLAIIAERNRHEAILQGLPGALLVVDDDFRVTLSNRQAESLFGMPAPSLSGANLFDLLVPDEAGREVLREAFLYEQQLSNKVLSLRLGGEARQVSLNVTFFGRSPRSAQASAAIIVQDITDWKRLEDRASLSEKLVAMGQLAAGVAHELNTPLGTILGYAQLLNEGRASEEKRAEYARIIHGETRRCARIVDNLLAYARRDVCATETCEVNGLIREAVEAVSNCQGTRLCVAVEADVRGELVVRGAAGQLDIVLVNLLVNAAQAAAAGAAPRVRVTSREEEGCAVISVTDNGPGVAPENRPRLFEPFFTTKGESAGTGLGLPISQSIVTRIGGSIHCDPDYRGGARFVVTLPLASQAHAG